MMFVGVALGWYGWYHKMHVMFILYWGILGLINGVMDAVKIIDGIVHSPLPLFSKQLSITANAQNGVMVACAAVLMISGWMAWFVYKAHTPEEVPLSSSEATTSNSYGPQGRQPATPNFQLFSGE